VTPLAEAASRPALITEVTCEDGPVADGLYGQVAVATAAGQAVMVAGTEAWVGSIV
jgi:hypothetical protein